MKEDFAGNVFTISVSSFDVPQIRVGRAHKTTN